MASCWDIICAMITTAKMTLTDEGSEDNLTNDTADNEENEKEISEGGKRRQ